MSDEDGGEPMAPESFASWNAFWTEQGMSWRTEPEIDDRQQDFLRERQAIQPNIENGIYPFKDINLTRADVEWLLAHLAREEGPGPVEWTDVKKRQRAGLDVRGANLRGVNLERLPLVRLHGGLAPDEWPEMSPEDLQPLLDMAAVHLEGAYLVGVHLEGATLSAAHLEGVVFQKAMEGGRYRAAHLEEADLRGAHLEGADLRVAHLEGTVLRSAHLEGKSMDEKELARVKQQVREFPTILWPANLERAFFDGTTTLDDITLGSKEFGFVSLADVRWGNVNLAVVDWSRVTMLGDEQEAGKPRRTVSRDAQAAKQSWRMRRRTRLQAFEDAARANRQMATVLRAQGIADAADHFAYRAQLCQRTVTRLYYRYLRYIGSLLLDLLAGYGYRPGRAILFYLAVILWFANFYVWATHGVITFGLAPSHLQSLAWYEALVLSVSSFHGRGFLPFSNLGDPVTILAAIEAILGLIIEVSFIATFTQRFFGK